MLGIVNGDALDHLLAAKVHDKSDNGATEVTDSVGSSSGEFPTIFYNNIGGSSKNTLIL